MNIPKNIASLLLLTTPLLSAELNAKADDKLPEIGRVLIEDLSQEITPSSDVKNTSAGNPVSSLIGTQAASMEITAAVGNMAASLLSFLLLFIVTRLYVHSVASRTLNNPKSHLSEQEIELLTKFSEMNETLFTDHNPALLIELVNIAAKEIIENGTDQFKKLSNLVGISAFERPAANAYNKYFDDTLKTFGGVYLDWNDYLKSVLEIITISSALNDDNNRDDSFSSETPEFIAKILDELKDDRNLHEKSLKEFVKRNPEKLPTLFSATINNPKLRSINPWATVFKLNSGNPRKI